MKKYASICMVLGGILFLVCLAVFWYQFETRGDVSTVKVIGLIASGTLTCVATFVRSRAIDGVGLLEITEKDREQIKEVRYDLNIWRMSARLLGGIASVSFIVGLSSLIFPRPSAKANWHLSVELIAVGLFLTLCSVLLLKRAK